jgi:4a-hydroxytetrahydrobiopterin dehydratase
LVVAVLAGISFWRAVHGYAELDDDNAIDPLGHGSTVWMQDLDPPNPCDT